MSRPCAQRTIGSNSSSLTPLSATALIFTASPGPLRGVDAGKHAIEIAAPRDRLESRGIEGVERDVDAAHAAMREFVGEACELRAVRGQRDLFERSRFEMPRERAEQARYVAADERLSAGDSDLARSHLDECRAEPVQLFDRQKFAPRQERHLLRHAIDTAEVAAVGDRHADIGDRPPERIASRARRPAARSKIDQPCSLSLDVPRPLHESWKGVFGFRRKTGRGLGRRIARAVVVKRCVVRRCIPTT